MVATNGIPDRWWIEKRICTSDYRWVEQSACGTRTEPFTGNIRHSAEMLDETPTDSELLAYLDETLSVQRSARIEQLLRKTPELLARLTRLSRWKDQGGHSLGEIWKRHRLSCLSRDQLEAYLLRKLDPAISDYIDFHLQVIECRFCQANLDDLRRPRQAGRGRNDGGKPPPLAGLP